MKPPRPRDARERAGIGSDRSTAGASDGAARLRATCGALLEDERWLAFVLLLPTVVLLGLFIAYPFVEGVLLSVTNTQRRRAGRLRRARRTSSRSGTTASSATRSRTPSSTRSSRRSSSWRSACGWRCCSTGTSRARRSCAPSSCCRSSSRPCCRPSPGSGCSTRPSASSTGCCSSSGFITHAHQLARRSRPRA